MALEKSGQNYFGILKNRTDYFLRYVAAHTRLETNMSIEYYGIPSCEVSIDVAEMVKRELLTQFGWHIVRESASTFGVSFRNPGVTTDNLEDVTVSIKPDQIYVGFYVGTRAQRNVFLMSVSKVLSDLGVSCNFEEE